MSGSISYTLNENDVAAAFGHARHRRASSRRPLIHNALAIAVIWLLVFGTNLSVGADWLDAARSTSFLCVAIFVPAALLTFLGRGVAGSQARRLFRQQRGLHDEYQASWTDEALDLHSASSSAVTKWTDFHAWQPTSIGYLIYLSDLNFYIMPRRAFTDERWADLGETLTSSGLPRKDGKPAATPWGTYEPLAKSGHARWWGIVAWSNPGRVALLWAALTFLVILDTMLFPRRGGLGTNVLFLSGTPVFAALLAGWVLRLRSATFALAATFLAIAAVFQIEWLFFKVVIAPSEELEFLVISAMIATLVAILALRLLFSRGSTVRNWAATGLLLASIAVAFGFTQANSVIFGVSMEARTLLGLVTSDEEDEAEKRINAIREIPVDRLWGAQSGLVTKAVEGLSPRLPDRPNIYALSVAGDGQQQLFAREARLALQVAAKRYGGDYRGGVLLSNGVDDVLRTPFATRDNMSAVAVGFSRHVDPAHDTAFVYLTSHGSPDAEIATALPTYDDLTPISSTTVNEALARSGFKRRIVVVSACYAGSWIPALANDDTIVITAARKDRTSFGCDDTRSMTFFGEAFLKGPLARGASLRDSFASARRTVARWEARGHLTPSEPQAFVGRNMRTLWTQIGSAHR